MIVTKLLVWQQFNTWILSLFNFWKVAKLAVIADMQLTAATQLTLEYLNNIYLIDLLNELYSKRCILYCSSINLERKWYEISAHKRNLSRPFFSSEVLWAITLQFVSCWWYLKLRNLHHWLLHIICKTIILLHWKVGLVLTILMIDTCLCTCDWNISAANAAADNIMKVPEQACDFYNIEFHTGN